MRISVDLDTDMGIGIHEGMRLLMDSDMGIDYGVGHGLGFRVTCGS